jgi:hypothetical protein
VAVGTESDPALLKIRVNFWLREAERQRSADLLGDA